MNYYNGYHVFHGVQMKLVKYYNLYNIYMFYKYGIAIFRYLYMFIYIYIHLYIDSLQRISSHQPHVASYFDPVYDAVGDDKLITIPKQEIKKCKLK